MTLFGAPVPRIGEAHPLHPAKARRLGGRVGAGEPPHPQPLQRRPLPKVGATPPLGAARSTGRIPPRTAAPGPGATLVNRRPRATDPKPGVRGPMPPKGGPPPQGVAALAGGAGTPTGQDLIKQPTGQPRKPWPPQQPPPIKQPSRPTGQPRNHAKSKRSTQIRI